MEMFGINIISVAITCLGMAYAIKWGVKTALIEFEAGKENLIEKQRQYDLLQDYDAKLTAYSLPGGMPKNMPKDEKKALRKRMNKISTDWSFSALTNEDAIKFNDKAKIILQEINAYTEALDD